MPTPTGTASDHRVAVPAGRIGAVAVVALARLGTPVPAELVARARVLLGAHVRAAELMADDLTEHRGRGVVLVGDRQPPAVHALAALINAACGAATVTYTAPVLADALDMTKLADALAAGAVETLVIADCNPVLAMPELAHHIARVPVSAWAGLHRDESARACAVELPLAHALEAWGDACSRDGTRAIVQPVIEPRFSVVSVLELCAALAGNPTPPRALVQGPMGDAEWRRVLARGVAGDPLPAQTVTPAWSPALTDEIGRALAAEHGPLEVALAPSQIGEGRFAHNAWLQELPHPITKQTWGNAALMSAATARRLGIGDEDVVRVHTAAGALELPALVVAGHADDAVTIELGYGRELDGSIADGLGGNGYVLGRERILAGQVAATGRRRAVARAQTTFSRAGREVAIPAEQAARHRGALPSRLPDARATCRSGRCRSTPRCARRAARASSRARPRTTCPRSARRRWRAAAACTGCASTPTSRATSTRTSRWRASTASTRRASTCARSARRRTAPTASTSRSTTAASARGSARTTARTRSASSTSSTTTGPGSSTTPMSRCARGVMEKCTYCVQRIRRAEQRARVEDRAIAPGEVVTACQEACPTGAIQFGALGERSPLAAMRGDPRRYEALHELGTRPRTQYLAKLRNRKEGA